MKKDTTQTLCYDKEKLEDVIRMISKQVKKCREKKGLSRAELAAMAGIHHSLIYKIEQGAHFSLSTALRLCAALDINLNELVSIDDGSSQRVGDCFERALRGCTKAEINFCYDIIAKYCHMQKSMRKIP